MKGTSIIEPPLVEYCQVDVGMMQKLDSGLLLVYSHFYSLLLIF
jgi:hypothetical protein